MIPPTLPPARLFSAPRCAFDTEATLVASGRSTFPDAADPAITFVAADDAPNNAHQAIVRRGLSLPPGDAARRTVANLRWGAPSAVSVERMVVVESLEHADAMTDVFEESGLVRRSLTFFAAGTEALGLIGAQPLRLALEPLFGDEAWRVWAAVEREILAEAVAPAEVNMALLDRSVEFKRKQQRETPPVRRFLGRVHGVPVAMIGYAPFAACDLGIGAPGPVARLRDVAVVGAHRRTGLGAALVRQVAARALEECGSTQVLICGASDGPAAALYRSVGARAIGACAMFCGAIA